MKTIPEITCKKDANEALLKISALQSKLDDQSGILNAGIDQLKKNSSKKINPLTEKIGQLETALKTFAEKNKDSLFAETQSIKMEFGKIGMRKSSKLEPTRGLNWEDVLDRMQEAGLAGAVRIKESVNKAILKDFDDPKLNIIGVKRVNSETFFYELKKEKAA